MQPLGLFFNMLMGISKSLDTGKRNRDPKLLQ